MFKRIFGHIGNEDITAGLLTDILKENVTKVELDKNPILEKDLLDDKLGILDIKAQINNNTNVDIEMQIVDEKNIEKRILYYWSKMYVQGIQKREDYSMLKKTIVILISNYNLENLKQIRKHMTKWNIREEEYTQTILTDVMEIYIIEMPKFKENNKEQTEYKGIDQWLTFIENPEVISMNNKNKALGKAKKVLDQISKDTREQYLAELRQKYIMDQKAIEDAGFDKGVKEGKKQIAKNMKNEGISLDIICKVTGLTKQEFEKL